MALGILFSKTTGFIRQRVIAHYFGLLHSDVADAWTAALNIPNFLQNLFGDGSLSASFIPVYAALLAEKKNREADRVAGAVGALLAVVIAVLVLLGLFAAPPLTHIISPGFTGAKQQLTIQLVRIIFPGVGLLVLSAWTLGILNSHHRFLTSYSAPVLWNLAMVVTLLWFGGHTDLPRLAVYLAWGQVVGSALQLGVMVPGVLKFAPDLRVHWDIASAHVRAIVRSFFPVFFSRGVVQLSAYIDYILASLLSSGALAGLNNAQTIAYLPISLFGMSISAAELPAMSGAAATDPKGPEAVRLRLRVAMRQVAFFVIPSSVAFLALGDIVAAAFFQDTTGRFGHADAVYLWGILAGCADGLLASTLGRLYSSTYYALRDTRTPLRYAALRVTLTTILGYIFSIQLPHWLGIDSEWGAAGLTASAGIAGWIEMLLLRRTLNARIGHTCLPMDYTLKLWAASVGGAAAAWAMKLALPPLHPFITAIFVLAPFAAVFFGVVWLFRIPELSTTMRRLNRFRR